MKYLLRKVIKLELIILIWTVANNANSIKGNGYGQNVASYHPLFNHDTTHRGISNNFFVISYLI